MRFSLKWLGDFIETDSFFKEPQNLADRLTQAGIEVDSFEDQKARFDKLVIAQILSVEKHPQADRLTVCEAQTDKEKFSIVCGAKNHREGDKVVLAQQGAVLASGLRIKKSRIRGASSEGMFASKAELGLLDPEESSSKEESPREGSDQAKSFSNKEEGIWILPESAPLGANLAVYKKWDDVLFEISVPPNRSDCLSHKGLAREISSLFSLSFKETAPAFKNLDKPFKELNSKKYFSVEVQDIKACPRYCACFIEGLEVKDSPEWLKQRLNSVGLKPINNVVDVTNFILWDQGQPLHAFDRDKIQNIQIAPAKEGEKFLSLDGNELQLSSEDLTIRDRKGVLALAGIMGGAGSGISSQTKNIMIESACFAPERIRKSSRSLGLETDSSYRFTRGVDPNSVFSAMERAGFLIEKLAGGKISKYFYDLNEAPEEKRFISLSLEDLSSRLGYKVSAKGFEQRMKALSCALSFDKKNSSTASSSSNGISPAHEGGSPSASLYKVSPPSYRSDLKIKEDLIEEFARLDGYDKIPENPPSVFFSNVESDKTFLKFQKWTQYLSSRSWLQSLHYSFCDPSFYKDFLNSRFYLEELLGETNKIDPSGSAKQKNKKKTSFSVNNPISQKLSLMKPLLTPDLFKSLTRNYRKNNRQGQIFELAPIFYQQEGSYHQDWHLALAIWGEALDIWQSRRIPNFYKMKTELEALFQAVAIQADFQTESLEPADLPFLHPKKSLLLSFQNRKIGFMGVLHPLLSEKHKIPVELVLAEMDLSFLKHKSKSSFRAFSSLLTVEKDLCFMVPESLPVEKVKKEIAQSLSPICEEALIFDIYKKEDQRFVSFRMRLSPKEKSWTDEELQSFLQKVIQRLDQKFSIKLKP